MGRKTKIPESYTGAVVQISRLRDALRSDPLILDTRRALAVEACGNVITHLLSIETEKDSFNGQQPTNGAGAQDPPGS